MKQFKLGEGEGRERKGKRGEAKEVTHSCVSRYISPVFDRK